MVLSTIIKFKISKSILNYVFLGLLTNETELTVVKIFQMQLISVEKTWIYSEQ